MEKFDYFYKKNNNDLLFETFKKNDLTNLQKCQNYIPLYKNFFTLNNSNYNNINLNNKYTLYDINSKLSNNKYTSNIYSINDSSKNLIEKNIFIKFSPILDPLKYMTGKYDTSSNLFDLPKHEENDNLYAKTLDTNNSAYIESLFTYLSSKLLHEHNFTNGLDFYGSFLAIKNKFIYNIYEDIEVLNDSDFFHKNKDILFTIDDSMHEEYVNYDTRNYKKKLELEDTLHELTLEDISDLSDLDNIFKINNNNSNENVMNLVFESKTNNLNNSNHTNNSNCSSRSSNTNSGSENTETEEVENSDDCSSENSDNTIDSCNSDDSSYVEDDELYSTIEKFPILLIASECCNNTLDYLLMEDKLSDKELESVILQVLMILITYQNTFNMTHNDLHTNNIMYVETQKQYLYYKINGKHYKVPTYGKIYKIIDFGRAIYKFRGELMCSDSYHPDGDAATQYNFEPYFNNKKPRLEPNMSFDLCRLGCSMYDLLCDDEEEDEITSPIKRIILSWCFDDKERNILYKSNGEERYPDFKLYKMIARTVHNHTPHNVLNNEYFERYIVNRKKINKNTPIINIDNIPCYV